MKEIRERFISKIRKKAKQALGIHAALLLSKPSFPADHNKVYFGGAPADGSLQIKYVPTFGEIKETLSNRENIVLELFLADMIQAWFEFQNAIFCSLVRDNQSHYNKWLIKPTPKPALAPGASKKDAIEAYRTWFDRMKSEEKLILLRKALEVSISQNLIEKINQYVTKRNLLQHNEGLIRQKDIDKSGGKNFTRLRGKKVQSIRSGDRIDPTPYDIEDLADTLIEVARILIP